MMMEARSPTEKPVSCSAFAKGSARALKSRYVRRSFSSPRSDSNKHTSVENVSRASRSAAPIDAYLFKSSMETDPTFKVAEFSEQGMLKDKALGTVSQKALMGVRQTSRL